MSHTNQTPNYHLPQFIGTDKPAWLVDFNQAMSDIDTQMKANETASGTAEADAQSALSGVSALNSQVGGIQTSVTALETAQPLDEAQIETNRQNIATNAQNIVDLDNRMGHTSISGIGDGSATGAIKAVDDKVGDLADLDTTDNSSIVNAINEVVAGGGGDASTVRYSNGYIQYTDDNGANWYNALKVGTSLTPIDSDTMSSSSWDDYNNSGAIWGYDSTNHRVTMQGNQGGTGYESSRSIVTTGLYNLMEGATITFNSGFTQGSGNVSLYVLDGSTLSTALITNSGSVTIPSQYANKNIKFVVTTSTSGWWVGSWFTVKSN